ncbi:MAG: hypothetical protein ACRC6V_19640 [Bacteroidales bacterium]
MAQPTNPLIVWASDDVILPNAQRPNKSLPSESLIQTGWDLSQKPAADEWNYLLNNNGQYIKWIVEEKINEFLKKSENLNDLPNKTTARSNLNVFSTSEVNSKQINTGVGLSGGGDLSSTRTISLDSISSKISILTGTITHGQTIPLPSGYTEAQCKWLVSPNNVYMTENNEPFSYRLTCFTTGRVVSVYGSTDDGSGVNPGTANYIVIGVA